MALVFTVQSYTNAQNSTIDFAKENLQTRTQDCKSILENMFQSKYQELEFISKIPQVISMDRKEQSPILLETAKDFDFEHIFVVDKNGLGYYPNEEKVRDHSKEEFFKNIFSNQYYMTEPFIIKKRKYSIITLSVLIKDRGKTVGALCGVLNLKDINSMIQNLEIGSTGFGFLLNSQGKFVAHKNMDLVYNGTTFQNSSSDHNAHDFSSLTEKLLQHKSGVDTVIFNHQEYFLSYTPLENTPWLLVLTTSKKESLKSLTSFAELQFIIIALALLVGVIMTLIKRWIKTESLAYVDALTGISNRTKCQMVLTQAQKKTNNKIAIINFDLNNLKFTNDTYGHDIGDHMLKSFSKLLQKTFGKNGFTGRMGGDEFIVILFHTKENQIENKLRCLENMITFFNKEKKLPYHLSTSYGYAVQDTANPITIQELYKLADRRMYSHKKEFSHENATSISPPY